MKTSLKALCIIVSIALSASFVPCIAVAEEDTLTLTSQELIPQASSLDELNAAEKEYWAALNEVLTLSAAFGNAQAAYDEASEACSKATEDLSAKRAKLEELEQALADRTAELEAAQADLQTVEAALDAARQDAEAAKTTIHDVDDPEAAVAAAQSNLEAANAELEAKQDQIAKGSFGFFEHVEATAALDVLNRTGKNNVGAELSDEDGDGNPFTSFTHRGEQSDATSLENMKNSLQWMKRANELRANEDVLTDCNEVPLMVSDTLMAMAQSNANWSDSHSAHADRNGGNFNVGENLAWNNNADPFLQWYDREKEVYLNEDLDGDGLVGDGRTEVTGHYANIVDPSFQSTGFAICTRGSILNLTTFCQTFSRASYNGEDVYTVEEYETRFMEYYNEVKGDPERAVETAQSTLANKQFIAENPEEALKAAEEALVIAEESCETLTGRIEEIQSGFPALTEAVEEAGKLVEQAEIDVTEAEEIEQNTVEFAEQTKAIRDEAQASLIEGIQRQTAAKAAFDEAQSYYDTDLAFATFTAPGACACTGKALTPDFKSITCAGIVLEEGYNYTLSYENNVKAGIAKVRATGIAPYHGTIQATFEIHLTSIANATVGAIAPQVFTGNAQAPRVNAKLAGNDLVEGRDYIVAYTGNVNAGAAKLTLNGIGIYNGSKSVTFQITPANISKTSVAKVKAQDLKAKGKEVKPKPTVKFNGKTLKADKDYTLDYKNNKKKGTAKIIIEGVGNFTGKKTVEFEIEYERLIR